jgi:general secretion pathway protein D
MNLLEQLREQRAIQITVETRFLTVQRNFIEDVGLDLNFLFNINGSWSNKISPIAINNPSSTFTSGPTTSVPGSIGQSVTSLTASATYLDDFQVTMLLRATQAQITSTIVQAPRITLYNGQRAYVLVALQQAYVSNLTAAVGTGVSAFQPTVAFIQSGVLLDVVATVSADRKYVTLTLRPQLASLIDLKSFTFQNGASAASGAASIVGGQVVGSTAAPSGTIQEPELQITEVKTTVTVPDGGTLLLGGQTIAGEIEKEVGVPVLSKIPFLKRLFTNRSTAKDEQVLLILVKPTILITREIEQKQFPLLTSKLGG